MNKLFSPVTFLILISSFLISLSSCSDDDKENDEPYPSIITELADCQTDAQGTLTSILLDNDTRLTLINPQTGLKANVTYRCLAGYTLEGTQASLKALSPAVLLHDSTAVAQTDPTGVVSLWRTGRYINLHLRPKTQGGKQTWGFVVDRIVGRHAYLHLHHRQGTDPTSYSTDVFASMPLSEVNADDFSITIETFSDTSGSTSVSKTWEL